MCRLRSLSGLGLLLLCICASSPASADPEQEPLRIPRKRMSEATFALLVRVVTSTTFPEDVEGAREKNLEALATLRDVHIPDFARIERLHLHGKDGQGTFAQWGVRDETRFLFAGLAADGGSPYAATIPVGRYDAVERVNPMTSLTALAEGRSEAVGVSVVDAVAAAELGEPDVAEGIARRVLALRPVAFGNAVVASSQALVNQGIQMLCAGAPRADVLRVWRSARGWFGDVHGRLDDLIATIEPQLAEDAARGADVEDPTTLSLDARVAYHAARLSDVRHSHVRPRWRGRRRPRKAPPESHAQALVLIGRPALPALIARLGDKGLARSIRWTRRSWSIPPLLRVEAMALACIVEITSIDFYRPRHGVLSSESVERHDAIVDDIRAWWDAYGSRPEADGLRARLGTGPLETRIRVLERLEALEGGRARARQVLRGWAVEMPARSFPRITRELAKRGDLGLLPAHRELGITHDSVELFLEHGNAADFRVMRRAAAAPTDPTGAREPLHDAVVHRVRACERPLAVPIHVDLLRRLRPPIVPDIPRTACDLHVQMLVRVTGHDAGYVATDPSKARFEAIDRWLAWWTREGEAAFLDANPEARAVVEPAAPEIDLADEPDVVDVYPPDPDVPVVHLVPRPDLGRLLEAGAVRALFARDGHAFQFTSEQRAMRWLAAALPARPTPGPRPDDGVEHVDAPRGRTSRLIGADVLHVDVSGVVWIGYRHSGPALEGYDPKRGSWIAVPPDAALGITGPGRWIHAVYESRAGRLHFVDRLGVLVLNGDQWRYDLGAGALSRVRFAEDDAGRVFLWSRDENARGLWIDDGDGFRHEAVPLRLEHVLPRRDGSLVLVDHDGRLHRLRDGILESGPGAVEDLLAGYRFERASVQIVASDGTAWLELAGVTNVDPIRKRDRCGIRLPDDAPATELAPDALALLRSRDWLEGASGRLWMADADGRLGGIAPDGRSVRWLAQVPYLHRVAGSVDDEGRLVLAYGDGALRIDPRVASSRGGLRNVSFPGVRLQVQWAVPGDDRLWCVRRFRHETELAIFGRGVWRPVEVPATGHGHGRLRVEDVIPGPGDSAILWTGRGVHLVDDEGWVHAGTPAELVLAHTDRVRRILVIPRKLWRRGPRQLVLDDAGRVWWSNARAWGVVDPETGARAEGNTLDREKPAFCDHPRLLLPLSGDRVLLVGCRTVVRFHEGKIVPVERVPAYAMDPYTAAGHLDSHGRWWVVDERRSQAFASGAAIGLDPGVSPWPRPTVAGVLLAETPDGELWFRERDALVRRGPDLEVRQRLVLGSLPRPPVATVDARGDLWLRTGTDLVRVSKRGAGDAVATRHPDPWAGTPVSTMWADTSGLLWGWQAGSRNGPVTGVAAGR